MAVKVRPVMLESGLMFLTHKHTHQLRSDFYLVNISNSNKVPNWLLHTKQHVF